MESLTTVEDFNPYLSEDGEKLIIGICSEIKKVKIPKEIGRSLKDIFIKNKNYNKKGIEEIDLSNCKNLEELYCSSNNIKEIDLSHCKKLKILNCSENNLKEIDLSQCKDLVILNCSENNLKEIDLSPCKNLDN